MEIIKIHIFILGILISGLCYSQGDPMDEIDSADFNSYYYIEDDQNYIDVINNRLNEYDYDNCIRMTYKPFIDISVIDSINSYRKSKNLKVVKYNDQILYDELFRTQIEYANFNLKKYDRPIFLVQKSDPATSCKCASSIFEIIMDDSLEFDLNKRRSSTLKEKLLDRRISEIQVIYFQLTVPGKKPEEDLVEENLYVYIKKNWILFTAVNVYPILVNEKKN